MFTDDDLTLDCNTCVAANTTACSECVVSHLLANDAGPIDLEPVPLGDAAEALVVASPAGRGEVDRVVASFVRAGLCADPPVFVSEAEFAGAGVASLV